jgi:hypothetical protein
VVDSASSRGKSLGLDACSGRDPHTLLFWFCRWGLELAEALHVLHTTPGIRLHHGDVALRNVVLRQEPVSHLTRHVLMPGEKAVARTRGQSVTVLPFLDGRVFV